MFSEPVENYLKKIYEIKEEKGKVNTSTLSEKLGVSSASVTEMVQRLAEGGLVKYVPYRGVELSEEGRRRALRIIRRHRLWERFLVEVLRFDWDEIHDEAERLEHSTSELLEERIDAVLGYPRTDPHGHIIPSADGVIDTPDRTLLSELETGIQATVVSVRDTNPEILQYMSKLDITIGTSLTVKERMNFDGSVLIDLAGREQFLSQKLAQSIFVEAGE